MSTPFEALLDLIYVAAEDPLQWQHVLRHLTAAVGGAGAAFHAGESDNSGFRFGTSFRVDPEGLREYEDYYYSVNPLNPALATIPVGIAMPDHALVPRDRYKNTEFMDDFSRRFDVCGSITLLAERSADRVACLGVVGNFRSEPFEPEKVALVQRLAPHLTRALALNRRLAQLDGEKRGYEQAMEQIDAAIVILAESGEVCYANAHALQLLRGGNGLRIMHGRLAAFSPLVDSRLAGAVRAALRLTHRRGDAVLVPRDNELRPLLVRIMPFAQESDLTFGGFGSRAIVLISDPESRPKSPAAEVLDAFGLTPSEKRLVNELVSGRSLKEAAETLNITRATSRNRLARIMSKTDTHRQSELIQLILRSSLGAS